MRAPLRSESCAVEIRSKWRMADARARQPPVVELYTLPGCYACARARRLLRRRGTEPIEIQVTELRRGRAQLQELTGG